MIPNKAISSDRGLNDCAGTVFTSLTHKNTLPHCFPLTPILNLTLHPIRDEYCHVHYDMMPIKIQGSHCNTYHDEVCITDRERRIWKKVFQLRTKHAHHRLALLFRMYLSKSHRYSTLMCPLENNNACIVTRGHWINTLYRKRKYPKTQIDTLTQPYNQS